MQEAYANIRESLGGFFYNYVVPDFRTCHEICYIIW